jgi:hypothetical protein
MQTSEFVKAEITSSTLHQSAAISFGFCGHQLVAAFLVLLFLLTHLSERALARLPSPLQ